MANARGKAIDNTHLSIDSAEERGLLHRDYIAHCLRWSHVVKFLMQKQRYKDAIVYDIGCGKEIPLAKTLYVNRIAPEFYAGFDVNKLSMPAMFDNTRWYPDFLFGETDFCDVELDPDRGVFVEEMGGETIPYPNIIVCFEVLEHIEPEHVNRMLAKFSQMATDCDIFLSTPCWDPRVGAAANHVNEMRYEAFGSLLERSGFEILAHYGTFASIRDYEHLLTGDLKNAFDLLRNYYDSNYLATVFAPMFPANSRNALWHVRPGRAPSRKFHDFGDIPTPWTSSDNWSDLWPNT